MLSQLLGMVLPDLHNGGVLGLQLAICAPDVQGPPGSQASKRDAYGRKNGELHVMM